MGRKDKHKGHQSAHAVIPGEKPAEDKVSNGFWEGKLGEDPAKMTLLHKFYLVFTLLGFLNVALGQFIYWVFSSDDPVVKQKAGQFVGHFPQATGENRFYPAAVYKLWHDRWEKTARRHLHSEIVQNCALEMALEESDKIIKNRKDFHVTIKDLTISGLKALLNPQDMVKKYQEKAPFIWAILYKIASAPNKYRKQLTRKEKKEAEKSKRAQHSEDIEMESVNSSGDEIEDWDDDPNDLEDLDKSFFEKVQGFSRNPMLVVLVCIAMLTFVRNRETNVLPLLLGLFFKIGGTSSRVMVLLSNIGLSVSNRTIERLKEHISRDAIVNAVFLMKNAKAFATIFDNINLFLRKFQQRLTNRNDMIHATNSAVIELSGIDPSAFDLKSKLENRGKRANAKWEDIKPTNEDTEHMKQAFTAIIAMSLYKHCPGSSEWENRSEMKESIERMMPEDRPLEAEKTNVRPFGVFDANEGSKAGIVKVLEMIQKRSEIPEKEWSETTRIILGDWLTSNNVRGAKVDRMDDVNNMERLDYVEEFSQLFHFALQATHQIMRTHLGRGAVLDPTCLSAHKDLLKRKWDVNKPNYAASKSLIWHSLIARLLHAVMVEKGLGEWEDLKDWRPDLDEVKKVAETIQEKYSTTTAAKAAQAGGDDWSAHDIYFIRDALFFLVFENAVSRGDAGGVLRILKFWALSFRGSGQKNYARECVEIILRLKYETTDELRAALERSWFVNRWGLAGRWIAADLYLEQLNYWVKRVFIASGNGITIEYIIKKGSSCVEAFRDVSHMMARFFGDADRARRSKEANFEKDLQAIVEDLLYNKIHTQPYQEHFVPRVIPTDKSGKAKAKKNTPVESAVVDVLVQGMSDWANEKFTDFIKSTTFDPVFGYPIPSNKDSESSSNIAGETGTPFDHPNKNPLEVDTYEDLHGDGEDDPLGGGGDYCTGDNLE